jgi:hypothetical protein
MVSKSFIAYACLFGFTTSINALRVASDRDSEPPREHDHHHARDSLFGSKLKTIQNIGDFPYPPFPSAFPIPASTDYPDAVEYRDLEALADRRLHHKHHTKHPHHPKPTSPSITSPTPVVKNRDFEAFVNKEFDSGKDHIENELQNLVRRLKLDSGYYDFLRHSVSAPQPTSTGGPHLVGFRDLGSLDDNLDNSDDEAILTDVQDSQDLVRRGGPEVTHKSVTTKPNKKKIEGGKRPRPTTTTVGAPSNLPESKGSEARADHDLASNEGSIDDESQHLDRRIKVTSGKSRPAPPPGSDGPGSVVSYRDLEGLVARALADRTFNIDAAIDTVESLVKTLVKGSSGSPSTPGILLNRTAVERVIVSSSGLP